MLGLRVHSHSAARGSARQSVNAVQRNVSQVSEVKARLGLTVSKGITAIVANNATLHQVSRGAAKQKLTPAQKSLREKQQHAKLVEEVMNKLDEPEYHYVNQGQRDAIKNHTNLVIVLHMVIDDNKEFKKRLDTWCSWNPGTPGVFAPRKTDAEKAAEKEKKEEDVPAEEVTPAETKATSTPTPTPKPAAPKSAPAAAKEDLDEDEPILPDEDVKKGSGKFELKSFLKDAGVPAKSIDSVAEKLKAAKFGVDMLDEVNDSWLKKNTGLAPAERQLILKQTFTYLAENPVD